MHISTRRYMCIMCDGVGVHACGVFVCAAKYREQRSHARHGTRKRRNRFSLSPRSLRFAYDRIISLWGRSTAELLHGNSISWYSLVHWYFKRREMLDIFMWSSEASYREVGKKIFGLTFSRGGVCLNRVKCELRELRGIIYSIMWKKRIEI